MSDGESSGGYARANLDKLGVGEGATRAERMKKGAKAVPEKKGPGVRAEENRQRAERSIGNGTREEARKDSRGGIYSDVIEGALYDKMSGKERNEALRRVWSRDAHILQEGSFLSDAQRLRALTKVAKEGLLNEEGEKQLASLTEKLRGEGSSSVEVGEDSQWDTMVDAMREQGMLDEEESQDE